MKTQNMAQLATESTMPYFEGIERLYRQHFFYKTACTISKRHLQFLCIAAIGEPMLNVRKVTPVGPRGFWDVRHAGMNESAHFFADVIAQYLLIMLPTTNLNTQQIVLLCLNQTYNR